MTSNIKEKKPNKNKTLYLCYQCEREKKGWNTFRWKYTRCYEQINVFTFTRRLSSSLVNSDYSAYLQITLRIVSIFDEEQIAVCCSTVCTYVVGETLLVRLQPA